MSTETLKVVRIANQNNKLQNEWFLDIGMPPKDGFVYSQLPIKVMVQDFEGGNNDPFECEITELIRYEVMQVPELYARLSSGKGSSELGSSLMSQLRLKRDDLVAVYLYRKVSF